MPSRDCDVENLEDFSRYYSNGWVGWNNSDSPTISPALVGPQGRRNTINIRFLSKTNTGLEIGPYQEFDFNKLKAHIDFGRPDIGMMPDGPTIVYLSYATPRQAHKGYRTREVYVEESNSFDLKKYYAPNRPHRNGGERYDWIWSAFNPEYKTFKRVLSDLQEGVNVGGTFGRNLAAYTLSDAQNPLLMYKRWTVGHIVSSELIRINRKYLGYIEDIRDKTKVEVQVI